MHQGSIIIFFSQQKKFICERFCALQSIRTLFAVEAGGGAARFGGTLAGAACGAPPTRERSLLLLLLFTAPGCDGVPLLAPSES
jgi:hypothetical protein